MKTIVIAMIMTVSISSFAREGRDFSFAAERMAMKQAAAQDFAAASITKADSCKQDSGKATCDKNEESKKYC